MQHRSRLLSALQMLTDQRITAAQAQKQHMVREWVFSGYCKYWQVDLLPQYVPLLIQEA